MEKKPQALALYFVGGIALLYAPFAMELGHGFKLGIEENLQYSILEWLLGEGYTTTGADHYQNFKDESLSWYIGQHAFFNGAALFVIALQLLKERLRIPLRMHQTLGVLYVILFAVGLGSSTLYLLKQTPKDTYSGEIFYYALWMLTVSTIITLIMGLYNLGRQQRELHKIWMQYHFAWMFSAPVLRILWVLTGSLDGGSHIENNIASVTLSPLVLSGGMALALYFKAGGNGGNKSHVKVSGYPLRRSDLIYLVTALTGCISMTIWYLNSKPLLWQWIPLTIITFFMAAAFNLYLYLRAAKEGNWQRGRISLIFLRFWALNPLLLSALLPLHRPFFVDEQQAAMGTALSIWGIGLTICIFRAINEYSAFETRAT